MSAIQNAKMEPTTVKIPDSVVFEMNENKGRRLLPNTRSVWEITASAMQRYQAKVGTWVGETERGREREERL